MTDINLSGTFAAAIFLLGAVKSSSLTFWLVHFGLGRIAREAMWISMVIML